MTPPRGGVLLSRIRPDPRGRCILLRASPRALRGHWYNPQMTKRAPRGQVRGDVVTRAMPASFRRDETYQAEGLHRPGDS